MTDFRTKFAEQHLDYLYARVDRLNPWEKEFVLSLHGVANLWQLSTAQYNKLKEIYDLHQPRTGPGVGTLSWPRRQRSTASG